MNLIKLIAWPRVSENEQVQESLSCLITRTALLPMNHAHNINKKTWAVVVAPLAERSVLIPEDPGSNPVIGNFY